MAIHLSIKSRLLILSAFAVLGVAVLVGVVIGSNRISDAALADVYEQHTETLVRLQRLENTLLEVRFRAAGVLLDQLPVQGSLNHLKESQTQIAALWAEFQPASMVIFADGEVAPLFKDLKGNWPLVNATLGKLEKGYVDKDKTMLTTVLEDVEAHPGRPASMPDTPSAQVEAWAASPEREAHWRARLAEVRAVGQDRLS